MTEPDTTMAAGMAHMHPRALASAASAGLVPSPPWGIGPVEAGAAAGPWGSDPAVVPICGEVDPLSGAVCTRTAGHGFSHRAVDESFEFLWTTSAVAFLAETRRPKAPHEALAELRGSIGGGR